MPADRRHATADLPEARRRPAGWLHEARNEHDGSQTSRIKTSKRNSKNQKGSG